MADSKMEAFVRSTSYDGIIQYFKDLEEVVLNVLQKL